MISQDQEGKEAETWRMDGAESLAVDEWSATYNINKRYPIDRDHSHMVKFESRYDLYYSIVRNRIINLLEYPSNRSSTSMENIVDQNSTPLVQQSPENESTKVEQQEPQLDIQKDPRKETIHAARKEPEGKPIKHKRFWRRIMDTQE